jgi:hypothetical protein
LIYNISGVMLYCLHLSAGGGLAWKMTGVNIWHDVHTYGTYIHTYIAASSSLCFVFTASYCFYVAHCTLHLLQAAAATRWSTVQNRKLIFSLSLLHYTTPPPNLLVVA